MWISQVARTLLSLVICCFVVPSVTDWTLTCYDQILNISCLLSERIVIHSALFGYFGHFITTKNVAHDCYINQTAECWTDVVPSVSLKCSGNQTCNLHLLYSIEFSHENLENECGIVTSSKPSLFVEYNCVSKVHFTKLAASSHVDSEQVGGYLTTVDYTDALYGGSEWRSQLAEANCQQGAEHLPFEFTLPAPVIQGNSIYHYRDAVSFVLTIKDFGLTKPAAVSGYKKPPSNLPEDNAGYQCPGPGAPCQRDYLEIQARLSGEGQAIHNGGASLLLPVTRMCLSPEFAEEEESSWIGRKFGPLPASTALQFTSNLNLGDPHALPGKGILIEYIALFCSPIHTPSGFGLVDYRFQTLAHSSHTVAYVEIFCPSDRWLEPVRPKSHTENTTWWLAREKNTTLVCDHHSRMWVPERIPEACLTDTELEAFVVKVRHEIEHPLTPPSTSPSTSTSISLDVTPAAKNVSAPDSFAIVESKLREKTERGVAVSVAIGVVVGLVVFLLIALLAVYCLRYRFATRYQKPSSYHGISERMTQSELSFAPSVPSIYPPTIYSIDWRKKWSSRSRWNLFKFGRRHTSWSQNLSGTFPDLPKQTMLHGSVNTMSRTPETVVLDRAALWRAQMSRSGASSYSLTPGSQNGNLSISTSPSPWHRTNSTTRMGMKPPIFASSADLMSPASAHVPCSWWLPWRKSVRKQRRLHNQLQRRRDAQYISQRRLIESSGISNSSSFHTGISPSTSFGLNGSTAFKTGSNGTHFSASMQNTHAAFPTRPASHLTNHSGCTADDPRFPVEVNFSYSTVDSPTRYATDGLDDMHEPLPRKATPPANTISEGIRRISSFLKTLNESITPPRSARHSTTRLHQQPRAMSSTIHPATELRSDTRSPMGTLSEYLGSRTPRCKSDSGSIHLQQQQQGFLRNLFNLGTPRPCGDQSVYNLIEDDSSGTEPSSGATRISHLEANLGEHWMHYRRRDSDACTLRANSSQTFVAQGHSSSPVDIYEAGNPYLIPSSVKRQRREKARSKMVNGSSDPEYLPSGTSSAISSLIFADSVVDEQESSQMSEAFATQGKLEGVGQITDNQPTTALEYFTYDQSRNRLFPPNQQCRAPGQRTDLFTTQIVGFPGNVDCSAVRKRGATDAVKNPRPLSDAMISNHYYDGDQMNHPEPNSPPPQLPPRNPLLHPPLPPLWAMPSQPKIDPPGPSVYDSADSLYETVDNVKPLARSKSELACDAKIQHENTVPRESLDLPPTPAPGDAGKAPVACMDDDADEDSGSG